VRENKLKQAKTSRNMTSRTGPNTSWLIDGQEDSCSQPFSPLCICSLKGISTYFVQIITVSVFAPVRFAEIWLMLICYEGKTLFIR
jgi:hypothetical protein